jgi:hypothetical protein
METNTNKINKDKRCQHIAKNYSWIQMTKDGIGNYILVESGLLIP